MDKNFREDFDSSVNVLLEGFHNVSSAYQDLAEKYYCLQLRHSATAHKLESLEPPSPPISSEPQIRPPSDHAPRRKLHEWLEDNVDDSTVSRDSIRAIKKAELVSCKLRSLLHRAQVTKSYRSDTMEQDFTIPGKEGKLGCPFTPAQRRKPAIHITSTDTKHAFKTAQSSSSHLDFGENGIKRPSIHRQRSYKDPITVEKCGYDAPTVIGSGAACPIRFLDQHSPEEVAQYFEKHKHELPRSHEICVKRFQDNAQSIRQLDAKYGSLVTMLQGLGMKHKPMLPEQADENVIYDEERLSSQKVEQWARSVNDESNKVAGPQEEHRDAAHEIPSSPNLDDGGDERAPRSDRRLKEIRVGESPSRPWGISIPPQYVERATSEHSIPRAPIVEANGEAIASVSHVATEPLPLDNTPIPKTAGQCPFNHRLQATGTANTPAHDAPSVAAANMDGPPQRTDNLSTTPQPLLRPTQPAAGAQAAASLALQRPPPPPTAPPMFTNHGIAVINSSRFFKQHAAFTNYGTVFIDSPAQAMELLRDTGATGGSWR